MAQPDLDERLKRLGSALGSDRTDRTARRADRSSDREARQDAKRARQEARELQTASVPEGVVMIAVALAIAIFGIANPHMWWLLFVALGIGGQGARKLEIARRRDRALQPASVIPDRAAEVVAPVAVSMSARGDALCDQLLAELKNSPQVVRDFVGRPEVTVQSIRTALRQLAERCETMRAVASDAAWAELEAEGQTLQSRLGSLDAVTYRRATDALAQRREMFSRVREQSVKLDSERQILLNTLETLRMRVALARTAGTDPASLQALEQQVGRLGAELGAITEGIEQAPYAGHVASVRGRQQRGVSRRRHPRAQLIGRLSRSGCNFEG